MVTMDFTPSPVYRHLQVAVISDYCWCWYLEWLQLGVLIIGCLLLTYLASVQLGSMYNYVDGLQSVPQVQDQNELISGHVHNLSYILIYNLSKIYRLIATRLAFLACRATFNNTFTLFQSKVRFLLFH